MIAVWKANGGRLTVIRRQTPPYWICIHIGPKLISNGIHWLFEALSLWWLLHMYMIDNLYD